jgi:hypothetical protein
MGNFMGINTKPTVEAGNHETLCAMFSISLMFAMLLAKTRWFLSLFISIALNIFLVSGVLFTQQTWFESLRQKMKDNRRGSTSDDQVILMKKKYGAQQQGRKMRKIRSAQQIKGLHSLRIVMLWSDT